MYYDGSYIIRMNGCQVFSSEEEAFNKFHDYIPAITVDDDDDDDDEDNEDNEDNVDGVIEDDAENEDDNCDNNNIK